MRKAPLLAALLVLACGDRAVPVAGDGGGVTSPTKRDAAPGPDAPFVAPADHRYCPGTMTYPPGTITCLAPADCVPFNDSNRQLECFSGLNPYPQVCGGVPPREECRKDLDCAPGKICERAPFCGGSACMPACTAQGCRPGTTCVDGRCVPRRCDEPGADPCAQHWSCKPGPGTIDTFGCAPDPCTTGAYHCPLPLDCKPGGFRPDLHGCALRTCTRATDCACGSCVMGVCEAGPGICAHFTAPP